MLFVASLCVKNPQQFHLAKDIFCYHQTSAPFLGWIRRDNVVDPYALPNTVSASWFYGTILL